MTGPKVAIFIYPKPSQLVKIAEAIHVGIVKAGGEATLFQVGTANAEDNNLLKTLDYPVLDPKNLKDFDAFLFGFPSYFGSYPSKFKAFWDGTVSLWTPMALAGKFAGVFVATGTLGGGQEVCITNSLSLLAHHGVIYVPLGYHNVMDELSVLTEIHGGSPWGAGVFTGADGKRKVSELELTIAEKQGFEFWTTISKYKF